MDRLYKMLTGLALILFSIAWPYCCANAISLIFSVIGLVAVLIGCFKK